MSSLPLDAYLDPTALARSYNQMNQQLFALAMSHNFASNSLKPLIAAETESIAQVVTLVPGFLYATELLLATVLLLCVWLAWKVYRSRLLLTRNPDCLAQVMDLARSPSIQDRYMPHSSSTDSILQWYLRVDSFKLTMASDGRPALSVTSTIPPSLIPQMGSGAVNYSVIVVYESTGRNPKNLE